MRTRTSGFLSVVLFIVLLLLSSCSFTKVGTIPSGTPDHGNGTPSLPLTPTVTPTLQALPTQSVATAPPTTLQGASYAFVRQGQLWVALKGASPVQVTHFDYTNLPNVFWHQPAWSTGDRSIAFIVNALGEGLGGGGCPGPQYGAGGALYVVDTNTMQLTRLTLPADSGNTSPGHPYSDFWQYYFWQDATHLLAWHSDANYVDKTSDAPGLYSYDLVSKSFTQMLPLSSLGQGMSNSSLLSIRYNSGQLYYLKVENNQLNLYRHSLLYPASPSSKVLTLASEAWCDVAHGAGPLVLPGWDISPNGRVLVSQVLVADGSAKGQGTIQAINLYTGVATKLMTQPSPADTTLTWGVDSQTIIGDGPYSLALANPTNVQQYSPGTPNPPGQISWRSSTSFTVSVSQRFNYTDAFDVYLYTTGNSQGLLLLKDARNFVWG